MSISQDAGATVTKIVFTANTTDPNFFLSSFARVYRDHGCSGEILEPALSFGNFSASRTSAKVEWNTPISDIDFSINIITPAANHNSTCLNGHTPTPAPIPAPGPPSFSCDRITFDPQDNLAADTEIEFTVIGFRGPPDANYILNITPTDGLNPNNTVIEIDLPNNNHASVAIFPHVPGKFKAKLQTTTDNLNLVGNCDSGEFTIGNGGLASGRNPCEGGVCQTAFGGISTDITEFASTFLSIAIAIAGGIALILLVFGSVRVLTSSGNQQTLAAGRDTIIAAIAGLLFLIFSVLILRALGLIVGVPFV